MVRIKHSKTATAPGDLNCSDWNSDHEIAEPLELADVENLKLLGYTLVEEKKDLSGVSSVVFDNLNGDEDVKYLIEGNIAITANSADRYLSLIPNGIITNQSNKYFSSYVDTSAYMESIVNRGGSILYLTQCGWSLNSYNRFVAEFFAKTGFPRLLKTRSSVFVSSVRYMDQYVDSYWNDLVTLITSLTLSITSGSSFSGDVRLWKVI